MQEEADSIIDTINERATEVRSLIITIGSILALLMPAVEMIGIIDFTPYGEGDDEWIGDDDWEWGDDFYCVGDNTRIEASMVNDGYKNCRDGSDEDESLPSNPDVTNPTIYGCTDEAALNYDDEATDDDDSCSYPAYGCTDPDAENYDEEAEVDNGSCEYEEPMEQECIPEMYDAWWLYNESYDIIYVEWDADLSCSDRSHNLTVYWTIYENETGNWTGLQEVLTYETYYQDWDYVNLTLTNLTDGRYDIFATFSITQNGEDRYSRATDWYDVCVGEC